MVVDARHDKARVFYTALGFSASLDDALCLYLPRSALANAWMSGFVPPSVP